MEGRDVLQRVKSTFARNIRNVPSALVVQKSDQPPVLDCSQERSGERFSAERCFRAKTRASAFGSGFGLWQLRLTPYDSQRGWEQG